MSTILETIEVEQIDFEKVQKLMTLDHKKVTMQNVITNYIQSNLEFNDSFRRFQDELIDITRESDFLKNEFYEKYVPNHFKNSSYSWQLDYFTNVITIIK